MLLTGAGRTLCWSGKWKGKWTTKTKSSKKRRRMKEKKTKWTVQMNIHEIMWYHLIWDGTNCKVAGWQNILVKCNIFISDWQDFFFWQSLPVCYAFCVCHVYFLVLYFTVLTKKPKTMPKLTMRQWAKKRWTEKYQIKCKMKKWTNEKTCRQKCETESLCNWMPLES